MAKFRAFKESEVESFINKVLNESPIEKTDEIVKLLTEFALLLDRETLILKQLHKRQLNFLYGLLDDAELDADYYYIRYRYG